MLGGWWQLKWGGNRARQTTAGARTHRMATMPLSWGRGSPQNEPQVPHTTGQHRPCAQRGSCTLTGPSRAPCTQHFVTFFSDLQIQQMLSAALGVTSARNVTAVPLTWHW